MAQVWPLRPVLAPPPGAPGKPLPDRALASGRRAPAAPTRIRVRGAPSRRLGRHPPFRHLAHPPPPWSWEGVSLTHWRWIPRIAPASTH